MIKPSESIQKVWRRDGINGVVNLGATRYAKNSIRANLPNSEIGRAIGGERSAVESKTSTDQISVAFALSRRFVRFRLLLCKNGDAV